MDYRGQNDDLFCRVSLLLVANTQNIVEAEGAFPIATSVFLSLPFKVLPLSKFPPPLFPHRLSFRFSVFTLSFPNSRYPSSSLLLSQTMNIFRFAGDMTHLVSILVLLLKIYATKSCSGNYHLPLSFPLFCCLVLALGKKKIGNNFVGLRILL